MKTQRPLEAGNRSQEPSPLPAAGGPASFHALIPQDMNLGFINSHTHARKALPGLEMRIIMKSYTSQELKAV